MFRVISKNFLTIKNYLKQYKINYYLKYLIELMNYFRYHHHEQQYQLKIVIMDLMDLYVVYDHRIEYDEFRLNQAKEILDNYH